MIQRIQSVFMFIAAATMIVMTFFPIWEKADLQTSRLITMNAYEVTFQQKDLGSGQMNTLGVTNVVPISIGAFVAAGVMLFSIFQYKNRITQVKLNALFSLVTAGTIVAIVLYSLKANELMAPGTRGNYLLGFYLPVVALFNNFLANRFIRKDEALVRSADRIR